MKIQIKKAILVGIQLPHINQDELMSSLEELKRLVTTLGFEVVGQITQKQKSDQMATVLGEGKLQELTKRTKGYQESIDETEEDHEQEKLQRTRRREILGLPETPESEKADIVIVDTDLSPSQLRNLEKATGVEVLDRTGVIIEIFHRHARTKAARLQVEIARLTYMAPRLRETGGSKERQAGRGAGESSLELDKRKIRDRIKELNLELKSIEKEQWARRSKRMQTTCVALVGYTNAGKSSLMRALTTSEVLIQDKLFATLDTTVRELYPEARPKILISDTVGFIKKLPHSLVTSFKSTLDEALNADLLLLVVDSSDPSFRSQLDVTLEVLTDVGAHEIPRILVLNKIDKLSIDEINKLTEEFPEAVKIATVRQEDVKFIHQTITSYFEKSMEHKDFVIPYHHKITIGDLRQKGKILKEEYDENGLMVTVLTYPEVLEQIQKSLNS